MVGQPLGQAEPLIPQPSLTIPALRAAVASVVPGRLPEMFAKMQEAFDQAGNENSVTPIHMFYREWAVSVEIERHPDIAIRLHAAEEALASDDVEVRESAIRQAGEIVRAAHRTVAGAGVDLGASTRLSTRQPPTRGTPGCYALYGGRMGDGTHGICWYRLLAGSSSAGAA